MYCSWRRSSAALRACWGMGCKFATMPTHLLMCYGLWRTLLVLEAKEIPLSQVPRRQGASVFDRVCSRGEVDLAQEVSGQTSLLVK